MKLSNLLLSAGIISLLSACSGKPADGYSIKGTVDGLDGTTIYLRSIAGDSTTTDSTIVTAGKFEFSGIADSPCQAIIYCGSTDKRSSATRTQFYIDPNSEIIISGLKADNFSEATFTGSKSTDEMTKHLSSLDPIYAQFAPLYAEMQNSADNKEMLYSLMAKRDSLNMLIRKANIDFAKNNPDAFHAAIVLNQIYDLLSFEELKSVYNSMSPVVQKAAAKVKEEIDILEKIQPGQPAPDLIGTDHNGKAEKLSDLKGKIVLIDFWATWCGPCRAALPHIKELYDKYHTQGFDVFCVADNDANPEEWAEFINNSKDGLQKYHHILRGSKITKNADGQVTGYDHANSQSSKYAVRYLPTKYLIDADGIIIGKIDDNEELDNKLAELFSK